MRISFGAVCTRALLLAAALFAGSAHAQEYPNRPVRVIVPFSPGGSTDTISRILAKQITAGLGQPMIVENKPGAGGVVGGDYVAKSNPDGYTLLFVGTSTAVNQTLYKSLPYDATRDLEPVIHLVDLNGILVVHPSVQARTVKDIIALSRAKPGTLNYASAGDGTTLHLAGEMFKSMAGADLTHIPYKGSGPALTDLIGGQVHMMFANMPGTIQHVQAGRIRGIAVTGDKRSSVVPDLPTLAEAGVPGYRATGWFGIMAPAGTPPEIIKRLNAEFNKALQSPELAEILRHEGAEVAGGTPEDFRRHLRDQIERWAKAIKDAGVKQR
jgi:tripartite-type tricarboxylate transporter receptor subunit TctC